MIAYLLNVKEKKFSLKRFKIKHELRLENQQADILLKLGNSSPDGHIYSVQREILYEQVVDVKELTRIDKSETWMDPL